MEIPSYPLKNFIILDYSNVKHGAEAIVLKGTLPSVQGDIAIKKWSDKLRDKDEKRNAEREVTLLMQNSHKNIIEFLGILIDDQTEWIGYVMPYMAMGSLDEIIHNKNKNYDDIYTNEQIKRWIVEICSGLSHLHSKNIIHRDVKPSNILLGASYDEVKLSDFGIARSLDSISNSLKTGRGTPAYMAPEIFKGVYNTSSDIYSLSITIWEILLRRCPFDHTKCSNMWELQNKISKGERPQLTNDLSQELSNLLKRCWNAKASQRPTIIEIIDFLTTETILLIGGWDGDKRDSLLLLVNNRNDWKQLNIKLPYTLEHHGAQFLNNHIYIFGGQNDELQTSNSTYKLVKSPQWYKLGNFQWEKMADMNQKRQYISNSSVVLNNQIWVCGGHNEKYEILKSVEMYDPVTNKWKYMKEMNEGRMEAAAAVVNGKIFCSGYSSVECYDPSSDVWTRICNMPQKIHGHGAIEMDGNLIIVGGYDGKEFLKNVWALDTTDKNAVWIEKPSMSIPHRWFSIAKIDGKVFVCGGQTKEDEKWKTLYSVEIFDGEVWRNGPNMPTRRCDAPAVVIPMEFARCLN